MRGAARSGARPAGRRKRTRCDLCGLCTLCTLCSGTADTSATTAASTASTASTAFGVVHAARGGERVQLRRAVDKWRVDEHDCAQAHGGCERREVRALGLGLGLG